MPERVESVQPYDPEAICRDVQTFTTPENDLSNYPGIGSDFDLNSSRVIGQMSGMPPLGHIYRQVSR